MDNLKEGWVRLFYNYLCHPFHTRFKMAAYDQQFCSYAGVSGEKHDSRAIAFASYIDDAADEFKPGVVAMGDPAAQKILFDKLKEAGVTELPAGEQRWHKSVIFPIRKETTEGPLSHLPETQGVGFIGSTIRDSKKRLEAAKHFTAHRFKKCLEGKRSNNLNYFAPSMHEDKFSDDPLGNMQ